LNAGLLVERDGLDAGFGALRRQAIGLANVVAALGEALVALGVQPGLRAVRFEIGLFYKVRPEFDRQGVFHLPSEGMPERRRPGPGARGVTAFSGQVQFEQFVRGWYQGWTLQRAKITEDLDAFLAGLPEGALRLLVTPDKGGCGCWGRTSAPSRHRGTG